MAENKPGKKVGRPKGRPMRILSARVPAEHYAAIHAEVMKLILRFK